MSTLTEILKTTAKKTLTDFQQERAEAEARRKSERESAARS